MKEQRGVTNSFFSSSVADPQHNGWDPDPTSNDIGIRIQLQAIERSGSNSNLYSDPDLTTSYIEIRIQLQAI